MKTKAILLILTCLLAPLASADVWEDLAKYEYGAKPNTAKEAFELLPTIPANEMAPIEAKLIAVVSDKNATADGKAWACRILQRIGTEKCIPAVAALLADEPLAGYARLALQRMEGSTAAADALRTALDKASDKAKVGILGSIGEGRDVKAVKQAAALAGSSDPMVAAAAMTALGKIATDDAATALAKLDAPAALTQAYLDALIDCSKRLGGAAAVPLCKKALAAKSPPHFVAAMQGLAAADPKAGVAMIADALGSDDLRMRRGAVDAIIIVKGSQLTQAVTAKLDDLPMAHKAELITALGSRGDTAALGSVSKYMTNKDLAVRDAAIGAAGRLGDASTVKTLLALGTTDAADEAKKALTRMQGADIDEALIQALADDKARTTAIQTLTARRATTATPKLLELVKDKSPDIRKEAWPELAALGREDDMAAVLQAATEVKDDGELKDALKAVKKVYATAQDKGACFATLVGAYDKAADPIKETLLALGAGAGNDAALGLERKALKSDNEELRKAAIRALADWPNAAPADDLLALATSAKQDVERILALRGYIGLAASDQIRMSGKDRIAMLKKVADLVKRDDEKKLVISGLAKTKSADAFPMLTQYMAEPAVQREAEVAAAALLWDVRGVQSAETKAMAQTLLDSEHKTIRERAAAVVSDWHKYKSYVNAWLIAGPYPEKGKKAKNLLKDAFPPETDDKDVTWEPLTKGIGRESVNFDATFRGKDNCCAYVKTTITSPDEQKVRLEMGSDDAIKAWLNGKVVHEKDAKRGVKPGQDVVTVTLKKGANTLMLKIVDYSGHWGFSCRIRSEKGMPIETLSISAE